MNKNIPVIHGQFQDDINYEKLLNDESMRDANEKVICKYRKSEQKVKTKKVNFRKNIG